MEATEKSSQRSTKELILGNISKFFSGGIVQVIGLFVNNYFASLLLGPTLIGVWQGSRLVLSYGSMLHLGVCYAMRREVAIERGRGNLSRQIELGDVTLTFNFLIAIVVCPILFVVTFGLNLDSAMLLSLRFIVVMLFLTYIMSFYGPWLRAHDEYGVVGTLAVFDGIIGVVSISLIFIFSFTGFLIGQTLPILVGLLYSYYKSSYSIRWRLNYKVLKSLIIVGIPLLLLGVSNLIFQTVDRLLILKFLDIKELGFYSLGAMSFGPIFILFSTTSSVMYQRFAERYGETGKISSLKEYVILPIVTLARAVPVIICGLYIALPTLVKTFLPKFMNGVPCTRILVFGLFFHAVGGITINNFFITINKQVLCLGIQLFGALLNLAFSFIMIKLGFGIVGVAFGTSLAYFAYFIISLAISMYYFQASRFELFSLLCKSLYPLTIMIFSAYLIDRFIHIPSLSTSNINARLELFIKEILFMVLSSYFIYRTVHDLELIRLIRKINPLRKSNNQL